VLTLAGIIMQTGLIDRSVIEGNDVGWISVLVVLTEAGKLQTGLIDRLD
jgi:hypothetical protein